MREQNNAYNISSTLSGKNKSYSTENQFTSRQFVPFKNQYVLFTPTFYTKDVYGDNLEKN